MAIDRAKARTPISLLTGFLGSGKTTVLRHLVQLPDLAKTVVVINEFGEIGLDHELVESASGDMVLLQSGCLCCTIRSDLVETLRSLYLRRVHGEIALFDRVIIETTGLADPAPILHTMIMDPLVSSHFRLDGVIATVDAATGPDTLDRQVECLKQAAVADRILVTKTDLVSNEQTVELTGRLAALNPGASIIQVLDGAVDPAAILNAGLYNPRTKSLDVQRWLKAEAYGPTRRQHGHEHDGHQHHGLAEDHGHAHSGHTHDVNRHDAHIKAVCLTLDKPIDGGVFYLWLHALVSMRGPDVLRVKGIVNVEGQSRPIVIHGVQHVFHPPVQLRKWPSADRRTKVVFITRNIDEAVLKDTLAIVTEAAAARPTKQTVVGIGHV